MKTIRIEIPSSTFAAISLSILIMVLVVEQTPVAGCQSNLQPSSTTIDQATTRSTDSAREQADRTETQSEAVGSTKNPSSPISQADADTVAEIMAIRNQLGGGISSQLEGVRSFGNGGETVEGLAQQALEDQVRSSTNNQDLNAELQLNKLRFQELQQQHQQRIELENAMRSENSAPANQMRTFNSTPNPYQNYDAQVRQATHGQPTYGQQQTQSPTNLTDPRLNVARTNSNQPASDMATKIRAAAQNLEKAAAELESTGLYHEADQIRDTARTLWHRARH